MNEPAILIAPDTLRIGRRLDCPLAQAWSLLTESAPRATWLAAGEMELVPGGRVELVFRNSGLTPDDDPPPASSSATAASPAATSS